MTMLNRSLGRSDNQWIALSDRSAISKWPVEETGMNSVRPSTIPRITTAIQSGIGCLESKIHRMTSAKRTFSLPATPLPAYAPRMFSHVVIFWTDPANPKAADELIAGAKKFLAPIPGIVHFHVG